MSDADPLTVELGDVDKWRVLRALGVLADKWNDTAEGREVDRLARFVLSAEAVVLVEPLEAEEL